MNRLMLLVALVSAALGGCGESFGTVDTVHPSLGASKVETSQTAFQLVQGRKLELSLAREWTLPAGEAVPDYEYIYILVPDSSGTWAVGEQGTAIYCLTRKDREESLYKATSGKVSYRFALLTKDHVHLDFEGTFEPVWPQAADGKEPLQLNGDIYANEDVGLAQGLINKYHDAVIRLEKRAQAVGGKVPAEKLIK